MKKIGLFLRFCRNTCTFLPVFFFLFSCGKSHEASIRDLTYPVYRGCPPYRSAEAWQSCMVRRFYPALREQLKDLSIPVSGDTLYLRLTVMPDGNLRLDTMYTVSFDVYDRWKDSINARIRTLHFMQPARIKNSPAAFGFTVPVTRLSGRKRSQLMRPETH